MSPRAYRDELLIIVLGFGHQISVDLAVFVAIDYGWERTAYGLGDGLGL